MNDAVGPVLRATDDVDGLIAAIHADNPGQDIEVVDRGAYVRVQARRRLRLTRTSVERELGRPFAMRELEPMLAAFAGRIETTSDAVTWEYVTRGSDL